MASVSEQRFFPRVPIILSAILRLDGGQDFPCLVTDISGGGAGVTYFDQPPRDGEAGLLDMGKFGVFKVTTLRGKIEKSGVCFLAGEADRNRLASNLILYVEEGLADVNARERWPSQLSLTRTSGGREDCEVLGITLESVCLATAQRPDPGELVRMGRMYGRVARHLAGGIEVAFLNFVNPDAVSPQG